jgi:hypothetical protein
MTIGIALNILAWTITLAGLGFNARTWIENWKIRREILKKFRTGPSPHLVFKPGAGTVEFDQCKRLVRRDKLAATYDGFSLPKGDPDPYLCESNLYGYGGSIY